MTGEWSNDGGQNAGRSWAVAAGDAIRKRCTARR